MGMKHLWHDINPGKLNKIRAVVEIPKGSANKYELDKQSGSIILDRVLHTAFKYPFNYGFIPRTYAEDGDPCDVLIIGNELHPLTLVELRIIGVLRIKDGDAFDDKLIGVPIKDPEYNEIESYNNLPKHFLRVIEHFYRHYKDLEGKKVKILGWKNASYALKELKKSLERYNAKYNNK
jgi:inorganic pyrophosphatase